MENTLKVGDKLNKDDYKSFEFHLDSPMRGVLSAIGTLYFLPILLFQAAWILIFSPLALVLLIYIVKKEYSCLYATANELIEYDQNTGKITNVFPLSSIKEVHLQQKSILSKFLPIGNLVLKTESDTTPLHWHTSTKQFEKLTKALQQNQIKKEE